MDGAKQAQPAGRGKVLVGLMLTMTLVAMDTTIVATAIPAIVGDLGGFTLFAWVFSIYTLVQAVAIPIFGKLSDLYGRKPVLYAGIIIFVAGSALSGISWNMVALILFRALQGIGAAVLQPTIFTVAGDIYTLEERGRIQGWLSSVWGVAAILGPAIGGLFTQYASWRWIFYINVPIGALAFAMIALNFREQVTRRHHDLDYIGSALLALGVGLLTFDLLTDGINWPWLSLPSIMICAIALLALAGFIWQERRAPEPVMPLWVFEKRLMLGSNLATLMTGMLIIGLSSYLPTYAQGVLHVSALVAGFALAVMSISWPIASSLAARVYMRIGFRNTALIGAVVCLASGFIFTALPRSTSILFVMLGSTIMGVGLGLVSTPLLVGLQSVVDWGHRGVVTGSNMFARQLGQTVGAAIFGSIVNASLASWLIHAPANLTRQLPQTVDAISQSFDSAASSFSTAAMAYLQEGLYLASHLVFVGLTVIALVGFMAVLFIPAHFKPIDFAEKASPDDAGTSTEESSFFHEG